MNFNDFNASTLAEIKARNLPHLTAKDIGVGKSSTELTPEEAAEAETHLAELDKYLQVFTPMKDGECICCGAKQGAKDIVDAFLTGAAFTWGLAYGEGFCKKCGYPGRGRHHVGDWFSCGFILQYHPDGLTFEKKITTNEH